MSKHGQIVKIAGPLVVASGMQDANMFDVVRVGKQRLIGEVIEMRGDRASIQVYEETAGITPGDEVETTGAPLSVELAPGLITTCLLYTSTFKRRMADRFSRPAIRRLPFFMIMTNPLKQRTIPAQ